jgi:hypothetical protein
MKVFQKLKTDFIMQFTLNILHKKFKKQLKTILFIFSLFIIA